jgi:hypothetical protein
MFSYEQYYVNWTHFNLFSRHPDKNAPHPKSYELLSSSIRSEQHLYNSNSSKNGIQFYMDELIELEQRIHQKIAQTKDKMHKTMERVVRDHLWREIETLNWVLNEILVFRQKEEGFFSNS